VISNDSAPHEVALRRLGREEVSLTLTEPQRPWDDEIVDFVVQISASGLEARSVVTSMAGDSLSEFLGDLSRDFAGWQGVRHWRSLEDQLRIEATWANRGHVTLTFRLRPTVYDSAWEASVSFDVEAGAEMESLRDLVFEFFNRAQ